MKKKVFHFVSTNVLSGLENIVINISTLIKDYNYTYVSPDGPIDNYLKKLGINHISIKKMTPFNVKKILKKYNPDIVHGHDVRASISLAYNYSICKSKNMKIISELHSDDPRMHKLSLRSTMYQLSTKYYDKIIVVSSIIINNYIFNKSIRYKTTIINNVINPLIVKNNLNFSNDNYYNWDCIFVGRLVKQKNPLLFVRIIYELKKYKNNISAVIVGDGPLKKVIINLIKYYDLLNNITIVGFQYNPYKYINNSKVLIMPSLFEGFGLVALESLIIGTPVVATPVGGLKKILNNNCSNFANNQCEFIASVKKLLFNYNYYDKKKKNANIQANNINNINNFIRLYKKTYEN